MKVYMCDKCYEENKKFINEENKEINQSIYCIHMYDKMKDKYYYELKNINNKKKF
jgi:hypothetical protein